MIEHLFACSDVSKEDWLLIVKLKKVFNITEQSKKKAIAAPKAAEKDYNSHMPPPIEDEYEDD